MAGMKALTATVRMRATGKVRSFPWLVPPEYKRADVRRQAESLPQRPIKVTSNKTGEVLWQSEPA